jgi:hypothetical protein
MLGSIVWSDQRVEYNEHLKVIVSPDLLPNDWIDVQDDAFVIEKP